MEPPSPKFNKPIHGIPNWEAVEKRLKREKQENLPCTDTSMAIREFRLAWKVAIEADLGHKSTGLVEQQACFSLLRKSQS